MRIFPFVFVILFLFFSSAVSSPQTSPDATSSSLLHAEKISLPGIPNAGKVSDSLFRRAQPHLSHLNELKKLGVTTIVDLRSESAHTRERERAEAKSLGIHFVSIPLGGFSTPSSAQLAEFFTLLREGPPQRVFVHCEFGEDRTGVFIASYRIAFEHWTPDRALEEMHDFGFHRFWHPSMEKFVRSLPVRLQSDPTLKAALGN